MNCISISILHWGLNWCRDVAFSLPGAILRQLITIYRMHLFSLISIFFSTAVVINFTIVTLTNTWVVMIRIVSNATYCIQNFYWTRYVTDDVKLFARGHAISCSKGANLMCTTAEWPICNYVIDKKLKNEKIKQIYSKKGEQKCNIS